MKRVLVVVLSVCTLMLSQTLTGQDAKTVVATASKTMGVDGLNSIHFYGVAQNGNLGQNNNANQPWPMANASDYVRAIDFRQPASRATWQTYAVPVMWRNMKAAKDRSISTWYRGTLHYNSQTDVLDLWPSALSKTTWSVYHVSVNLTTALSLLRVADPADRSAMMTKSMKAAPFPMP